MKFSLLILLLLLPATPSAATPIRPHPDNPRWFEWRGRVTALITSGEVHSSVVDPVPDWKQLHTLNVHPPLLERQTRLVRWLVRELSGFDNVIFEIQIEPWSDNHTMGDFINPCMLEQHNYSFTTGREDGTDPQFRNCWIMAPTA